MNEFEPSILDAVADDDGGAQLLSDVRTFISRFCVFPDNHCLTAVTLWAAHTHMVEHFYTTPRLALLSPEPSSGKTRVLTYRIAHLIRDLRVRPESILAITFTNKAADEMKERVGVLVGGMVRSMWVSTFHSACVRMLRREASRLGYKSGFSIYDESGDVTSNSTSLSVDLEMTPAVWPEMKFKYQRKRDFQDYAKETLTNTFEFQARKDIYGVRLEYNFSRDAVDSALPTDESSGKKNLRRVDLLAKIG